MSTMLTEEEVTSLADEIRFGGGLLFEFQASCDAVARELGRRRIATRRRMHSNRALDPRHTVEKRCSHKGKAKHRLYGRLYEIIVVMPRQR